MGAQSPDRPLPNTRRAPRPSQRLEHGAHRHDILESEIREYSHDTNAGLGGARIYMQIVAEDTGNSNGFSSSRGMWAGIAK